MYRFSVCVNVVSKGSPSLILMVLLISLGITTRPRSSMRRTIPVAFIYKSPLIQTLVWAYCLNFLVDLYLVLIILGLVIFGGDFVR